MKFLLLSLFFTGMVLLTNAQDVHTRLDSLAKAIEQHKKGDTNKVKLLVKYARELINIDQDQFLPIIEEAESLSKVLNWEPGVLKTLLGKGFYYGVTGEFARSIEFCLEAAAMAERLNDIPARIKANQGLGDAYRMMNNLELSNKFFLNGLELSRRFQYEMAELDILITLAEMSSKAQKAKEYEQYFSEASVLADKLNNPQVKGDLLLIKGGHLFDQGICQKSIEAFKQALAIYQLLNSPRFESFTLGRIAHGYGCLKNSDSAEHYLNKSMAIVEEYNLLKEKIDVFRVKYIIEAEFGNFREAVKSHLIYDSLLNEFQKSDLIKLSDNIQLKYDQERINLSIKQETEYQKKLLLAALVGAVLLSGFFVVGFLQRNRIKKQKIIAEQLKNRSEALLYNILPEEVARELSVTGSTEARQFDEVSVLFTDFEHFTQKAENLMASQLVEELNACFTAFDEIIVKHGLEKIKTIGDAYMAVCGLPSPHPKHAQKVVQAALEIRDFIDKRSAEENTFQIRIGVNSGSVVAGIVGVKKFAYDIWGDTVNTAARMESSGEPGKVNISSTTYDLVKDDFSFTHRGKVGAKGKGEMDMYFVEKKIREGLSA